MDIDLSTLGLGLGDDDKLNISFNDDTNFKDIDFGNSGSGGGNLPTGFGPGIELLINDKKRNNGYQPQASSEKDLGDLGAFDQKMNESIGGSWNAGDAGNSGGNGNEKRVVEYWRFI